ncbi:MAG: rRNA maturation RNase YbeY [Patescibacteria group bacterium]
MNKIILIDLINVMKIEIYNQTKQKINKKLINKIVQEIFRKMKFKKKIEISVVFVGEKKIKQLNKKYRNINKITDVLSFGLWKLEQPQHNFVGATLAAALNTGKPCPYTIAENNFGEIFICYQKIKKQAKIFQHSILQELKIILIHGTLHLLGYDHKTKKDWEKMKKIEKEILISL